MQALQQTLPLQAILRQPPPEKWPVNHAEIQAARKGGRTGTGNTRADIACVARDASRATVDVALQSAVLPKNRRTRIVTGPTQISDGLRPERVLEAETETDDETSGSGTTSSEDTEGRDERRAGGVSSDEGREERRPDPGERATGERSGGQRGGRGRATTWAEAVKLAMKHLEDTSREKEGSYNPYYDFFLPIVMTTLGGGSETTRMNMLKIARWAIARDSVFRNYETWLPEQWAAELRVRCSFGAVRCAALAAGIYGTITDKAQIQPIGGVRSVMRRLQGQRNPGKMQRKAFQERRGQEARAATTTN